MQRSAYAAMGALLALAIGTPVRGDAAPPRAGRPTAANSMPPLDQILAQRPVVTGPLSLDQAVATALRDSPVVRGAAEEVEADLGRLDAARAQTRPQLSLTSFGTGGSEPNVYTTTDPVRPTNLFVVPRGTFFDQNATLMLPLYTGGRLRALVRQAAAGRGSASADLEAVRQEVALMTRTAFRDVLARRALIDVARAVVTANQEQLRVDQSRFQAGAIPEFYLRRDEAALASAQQQLTNAQRDADLSLAQLKTVIGVHPDSPLEPAGSLAFEPAAAAIERLMGRTSPPAPPLQGEGGLFPWGGSRFSATPPPQKGEEASAPLPGADRPAPPSLAGKGAGGLGPAPLAASGTPSTAPPSLVERYRSRLLALAERQRPELRAARLRVDEAAAGVSVARSASLPQVGIAAMGDLMTGDHSPTFGGTSFGLTASLPLFDAGLRRADRRTAEADRRHREADYEKTALDMAQQVTAALLSLGAAEQNVATAQAGARAAEAEYGAALQRYQAGRGILVEALDALAARTHAQTDVIQALYDYTVAQDQLRRAVGQTETRIAPS
jgi:outer membrane protein TolC